MKLYETIRISSNGRATYGDKYVTIGSDNQYQHNDFENGGVQVICETFDNIETALEDEGII